ncbi:PAS domain-containing protein [Chryseosolibacter indicus]|uniref:PAS domain-containing protein n=1 Tax=Chryseosolibacter indicus TaxID=2782351 RepID=A0ABS5VV68_9BACT|nr:PAS domain-containing protein [Chryseosolibacter indicus]MBT1704948.1 PAS domain-containing protein [Chryseosolibacter indicus]
MKLSKSLRYSLFFAAIGIVTSSVIIYVQQRIKNTYEANLPFVALGDHIKSRATTAYLKFEELIEGDKSVVYKEHVQDQLIASRDLLQHAYDGKETVLGKFTKSDDEETRALLKESAIDFENLLIATNTRWEKKQQLIGNDSLLKIKDEADEKYEMLYSKSQADIDRLAHHISNNTNADRRNLSILSWTSFLLLITGFGFLCFIIYRLQFKSDAVMEQNAAQLSEESNRVSKLSDFIEAVSAGNYNIELKADDENDNLTSMLIKMRDKLRSNAEDDRKRNWTTTGLAQIGELLRANTSSSSELYDNIIRFVVKYTKSNQGGLFILNNENENDQFLELVACYAFERKKYLTRKVTIGDGLVGQCYLEGERIYLLEVPQEYVSITSGLGGSNPNALLIVPMKVNDRIYGVIELASFNKYAEYEIELVEKLAESIASTISNVRINETTRILLEKTQQQSEEMKSQEEEIRQNMEELEATQEEMRRKQTVLERELEQSREQGQILRDQERQLMESQDTLQAIVDNLPRAIYWKDKELRYVGCNKVFAALAGVKSYRDVIGKTDYEMAWGATGDAYRKDDLEVMNTRKPKLDEEHMLTDSNGAESWLRTSKIPVINEQGEVVAVLGMVEDVTEQKRKDADLYKRLHQSEDAQKELQALKELLQTRKI